MPRTVPTNAAAATPSAKRAVSFAAPSKGEETRAAILREAVRHASSEGYAALTIGTLAEKTGLSKSGLFAHFGSKEELQIATLDEAVRNFNELAFFPALQAPRGLNRLIALFDNWLTWTGHGKLAACPMMIASHEFDDTEGAMRDAVVHHMQNLHRACVRSAQMCIDSGEFAAETDADQFAFELFGIIATCYRARTLFRAKDANVRAKRAFDRLVQSCLPPAASTSNPTKANVVSKSSAASTRSSHSGSTRRA
jgi:AcrR family transcriptional regulator